jgi:hypothetical protein
MKSAKRLLAIAALSALFFSFTAQAALEVETPPAGLRQIGIISTSGGANRQTLQSQLSAKADVKGAIAYRIISVNGPPPLYGTAAIYK